MTIADLKRKKDSFYFPGKDSTNEYVHGYGHIAYYRLSNFLFSCIKHSPSLAMWGKLHMAHHGCRPRIAILNRSQTHLFWRNTWQLISFKESGNPILTPTLSPVCRVSLGKPLTLSGPPPWLYKKEIILISKGCSNTLFFLNFPLMSLLSFVCVCVNFFFMFQLLFGGINPIVSLYQTFYFSKHFHINDFLLPEFLCRLLD